MDFPAMVYTYIYHRNNIKIYYPFVASQHTLVNSKVNQVIQHQVWKLYNKQYVNATEMVGFFKLKTNENKMLSITIDNYAYSGEAHGMTIQ